MESIYQSVQAFDQNGRWMKKNEISKIIKHSITQVEQALITSKALPNTITIPKAALNKKGKKGSEEQTDWQTIKMRKLEDGLKVADLEKLYKQIPALAMGVQHWQQWAMQRLHLFVDTSFKQGYFPQASKSQVKACLLFKLLPWVYWQTMRRRLSATTTNRQLKSWYLKMIQEAQQKVNQCTFIQHLTTEQYELCLHWAGQVCRTFQRSSAQVEGRNGYLAFVHKFCS